MSLMDRDPRRALRVSIMASLALALPWGARALAQDPMAVEQQQLPPPSEPATKPPAKAGAREGAPAADSSLVQRVEQLEEQLVDLQVVIGTLESLARSGVTNAVQRAPAPAGAGASDQARLDGMETQIRAISAQIEQLSAEMRAQGPARRSEAPQAPPAYSDPTLPHAGVAPQSANQSTGRFGSTTVTSGSADPIAGVLSEGAANPPASGPPVGAWTGPNGALAPGPPGPLAAAEPAPGPAEAGNPKQAYENAYGFLLQQDYGAAQSGFSDFLKRYPQDPLAPNALYWLGETHYVQKNYADAAEAFDLVLTAFGSSAKAPDAQLKRAMALAQLGKKQDACAAFRQLGTKFPNAPAHVKAKADSERQRAGCS